MTTTPPSFESTRRRHRPQTRRLRRARVLMAATLGTLSTVVAAQFPTAITNGWSTVGPDTYVLSSGYAYVEGYAEYEDRITPSNSGERLVQTVIADRLSGAWPGSKGQDAEGRYRWWTGEEEKAGSYVAKAACADLVDGYAYVKISNPAGENVFGLDSLPWAIVLDAQRYLSVLMPYTERMLPPAVARTQIQDLRTILPMVSEDLRSDDGLRRDVEAAKRGLRDTIEGAVWAGLPDDVAGLARAVIGADADRDTMFRAVATTRLVEKVVDDLGSEVNVLGNFRFPFVTSRWTVGGAPGTEIAVWVEQGAQDNEATVHYAYLYTGRLGQPDIKIGWHEFDADGDLIFLSTDISMGSVGSIPVTQPVAGGPWIRDGNLSIRPIATLAAGGPIWAAIKASYRDACIASVEPHSPLTFGQLQLTCAIEARATGPASGSDQGPADEAPASRNDDDATGPAGGRDRGPA